MPCGRRRRSNEEEEKPFSKAELEGSAHQTPERETRLAVVGPVSEQRTVIGRITTTMEACLEAPSMATGYKCSSPHVQ